ncbi:MAG: hypothetical protein GY854_13510 [Deltaproteobacteria bacterium]|nr:hypothetical protein [Deltaproteobacteria bacterium]
MWTRKFTLSFSRKEDFFKVYTPNASEGAVFVATQAALKAGEPVELKLCFNDIPEGVPLKGHVIWRRLPTKWRAVLPPGIGIRLIESERRRLEFLIDYCDGKSLPRRKTGERLQTDLPVDFFSNRRRLFGRMLNISRGGVFIETPHLLPTAAPIELNIHIEENKPPQELKGQVVWQRDRNPSLGFGVKFNLPSVAARDTAAELVRTVQTATLA